MYLGRTLLAFTLSLLLSACSGGSGSSDSPITSTQDDNRLLTFAIANPSHPDADPVPINTTDTNAITWTTNEGAYNLNLYLSDNDTLSALDLDLFFYECGVTDDCETSGSVTLECTFNNSNELTCADGTDSATADLTDYLPQLPFDGYIIAEYCEFPLNSCTETLSQAVQLQ